MTRKPRAKKKPSRAGKAKPRPQRTAKAKAAGGPKARRAKAAQSTPRVVAADPLDDFIATAVQALDLPVAPEWQAAIKANLAISLRFAAQVAAFTLPDEAEPAPVFRA